MQSVALWSHWARWRSWPLSVGLQGASRGCPRCVVALVDARVSGSCALTWPALLVVSCFSTYAHALDLRSYLAKSWRAELNAANVKATQRRKSSLSLRYASGLSDAGRRSSVCRSSTGMRRPSCVASRRTCLNKQIRAAGTLAHSLVPPGFVFSMSEAPGASSVTLRKSASDMSSGMLLTTAAANAARAGSEPKLDCVTLSRVLCGVGCWHVC